MKAWNISTSPSVYPIGCDNTFFNILLMYFLFCSYISYLQLLRPYFSFSCLLCRNKASSFSTVERNFKVWKMMEVLARFGCTFVPQITVNPQLLKRIVRTFLANCSLLPFFTLTWRLLYATDLNKMQDEAFILKMKHKQSQLVTLYHEQRCVITTSSLTRWEFLLQSLKSYEQNVLMDL